VAEALILDSEAIGALAFAGQRAVLAQRARAHAVDAFVVATALAFDSAVIATHDPDDLARLAAGLAHVRIFAI
jgi:hypothetical protein